MKDNIFSKSGIECGTQLYNINKLENKRALVIRGESKYSSGVIIYLEKEKIYLWLNNCPHASLSLELIEGKVQSFDGNLICANHGAKFDPKSGLCIKGPCKNKKLQKFPYHIKNNNLIAG